MAERSAIEWTDATFNPWIGCTKVSPACEHCYAEVSTPSRRRRVEWGAGKPRYLTSAENRRKPLRWNAKPFWQCNACGWRGDNAVLGAYSPLCPTCMVSVPAPTRRRVFCSSLSDWLDNEVPAEWLADLLDLIRLTPNLDWLLLTKRVGNWRSRLQAARASIAGAGESIALRDWIKNWLNDIPPPNVWVGATVCNQDEADRDIPKLLRVPAAVRFLSIEPMLGPIRLWKLGALDFTEDSCGTEVYALSGTRAIPDCDWKGTKIDWVIAGGESGAHARPPQPDWFRSLRDQCADDGVPFLFKQWGEYLPADDDECDPGVDEKRLVWSDGQPFSPEDGQRGGVALMARVGKKAAGRLLDGVTHDGYPEVHRC